MKRQVINNIKPRSPGRSPISRRRFVTGMAACGTLWGIGMRPGMASGRAGYKVLEGKSFDLDIGYQAVNFTGKTHIATTVNGALPGPVLRWREGDSIRIRVKNNLAEDSSIHWHGMILPADMDGVPGISFDGIKPGATFEYRFDVGQSGTYWYHSHSGFQEPAGLYGAIVVEPRNPDPVAYNRDYVIMLSDWSDEAPTDIYAKLKKMSHYYNSRARTTNDLWRDIKDKGIGRTWRERAMWNQMRMSETDISDVSGYTFLTNGQTPEDGWVGVFKRGEKVRLRFINSSSMTIFDVRIPGLKMTVVAADGQNIEAVSIDEFRIGVAETYDVIVEPADNSAYTIFAQSIDRSGYTRGTLTSDIRLTSPIPAMDPPPILAHRDMGMGHSQHHLGQMSGMNTMPHKASGNDAGALGKAGFGSSRKITHVASESGPQVGMRAENPRSGLNDPGIGLRDHQQHYGRRVLTYADLRNIYQTHDPREPNREIELHLTGNMNRYMWSINGIKFADADPLQLKYGERVRITLVNDTMMSHPMHLHGMWSEIETGAPDHIPRKHTVMVQPGSKISYLVSADALGSWAYHCHLMFHMSGMFREVRVS